MRTAELTRRFAVDATRRAYRNSDVLLRDFLDDRS
jgi:hypothetical protein